MHEEERGGGGGGIYLIGFVEILRQGLGEELGGAAAPLSQGCKGHSTTAVLSGTGQKWELGEFCIVRLSFILPLLGLKRGLGGVARVYDAGKHGLKKGKRGNTFNWPLLK